MKQDIKVKKIILSYLKIKLNFLDELEIIGFGINEFRTLYYLLNEIGLENNLEFDVIIKQFFDDVKNYEEVIGARKEIDNLKNERKILEDQNSERKRKMQFLSKNNRKHK